MHACFDCRGRSYIGGSGGRDTHGGGDRGGGGGGERQSDESVSSKEGAGVNEDVVMVGIRPAQCLHGGTESD